MSKIKISDIGAVGPELDEGDLKLVNGGRPREFSTSVTDIGYDGPWCRAYEDVDACFP
ncbi:hypothetical protein [Nonomuraea sp. NPDC050310]|uniref:hypothetical protein n=1 Tax=Nonomuraea sp. NPDC050310 TaxID=3154935 RepID=UPI003400BA6E